MCSARGNRSFWWVALQIGQYPDSYNHLFGCKKRELVNETETKRACGRDYG